VVQSSQSLIGSGPNDNQWTEIGIAPAGSGEVVTFRNLDTVAARLMVVNRRTGLAEMSFGECTIMGYLSAG